MSPERDLPVTRAARPLLAIFWGGLLAGIGDITQAFIVFGYYGAKPLRILQSIAAGLLGPASFQGGYATAALGSVLRFVIAFGAATVFYVASRYLSFLTRHAVIAGMLFGEAVYLFMYYVVIPLSATKRGPFSMGTLITGPFGHMFLVGLPIALAVRKYAGQTADRSS